MVWNPNETTTIGPQFDVNALWGIKPQQPMKKKEKNFWLDQISTVGGIGGGILGSLVAPIAGTAAGAGIGSALGETLENILTGDQLDKNVVQEGALGAIFGAGPLKLGKAGLGLLTGRGARVADDAAKLATNATSQATTTAPLKTSFAGKMNALGDKALASQYGTISKPVARSSRPIETISQLADLGITKPKDAEKVADLITGSRGLLTKTVAQALDKTTPISTTGIKGVLRNAITTNGLVDKDAKSVTNIINSQLKTLKNSGNNPKTVLKVMQNLEKRAANLQGKGNNYRMATPERVDQANALLAVRNELQERLYTQGGGNTSLESVLTPKLRNDLVSIQPNNQKWRQYVDDNIMGSTDLRSLRSAQAPFVRIKNIIDEGDINSLTFGGRMGNNPMNGGTVANTVINTVTDSLKNPAARMVAGPLRNIGKTTTPQSVRQSPKAIATRLGLLGALTGSNEQTLDQSAGPNIFDSNTTTNAKTNSMANIDNIANIGSQYQNPSEMSSPYGKMNLLYDIQRDPANAADYIHYYQMLQEVFTPEQPELSSAVAGRIADTEKGLQGLQDLDALVNSSDYAGGALQGTLRQFNPFDTEYKTQQAQIDAVRQFVGKALEGGVLRKEDEDKYRKILPTLQDAPEVAKAKINYLTQMIQRDLSNYRSLVGNGGGGTSLEDALMLQGTGAGGF